MLEELRSMAVFATVVREHSFRAAARQLGLSPSVVSHHVAQLEKRLGCALLYRTTRHLALTPDGQAFYESCVRAVEAAEEGLSRIRSQQMVLTGRLRLGAPALLAEGPFMEDISGFAHAHPGVDIELVFDDQQRHPIAESVDVSIRIGWLEDSALRARLLFEVDRVLCASPSLLAQHPPVHQPGDLGAMPWIRGPDAGVHIDLTDVDGVAVRTSVRTRVIANNGVAQRQLAVAGVGVFATVDFFVRHELACGRLVRILSQHRLRRAGVFAVWPDHAVRNPLGQRFIEFLVRRVGAVEH